MSQGRGQQGGDWLWERGVGGAGESKEGETGATALEQQ